MKKLILSELLLLFLATTFMTDSLPPGWYQQTLPVNDQINDIFFLDSLTGWVVTAGASSSSDTGYIMKTSNGGGNWVVQYNEVMDFRAVQFLNLNTGYAAGGVFPGKVYKTTNSGTNWVNISSFASQFYDLFFVNINTGWVADANGSFGGLFKTTNGGINWTEQLSGTFFPQKLFFINADTGWAGSNEANSKLYRTTNGGLNWNLQFTFNGNTANLFFITKDTGFITGNFTTHSIKKTVDGGFNWSATNNESGGRGLFFTNTTSGWICDIFATVKKSTDGGINWFNQTVPLESYYAIQFLDTTVGWSGGSKLIKTTDGGGPPAGVIKISNEIPSDFKLYQNYPNPFNPSTIIRFQIQRLADIKLIVYDITGREITVLIDGEYKAGTYEVDFDGSELSTGVYFYKIIITAGKEVFSDVKKMLMLK